MAPCAIASVSRPTRKQSDFVIRVSLVTGGFDPSRNASSSLALRSARETTRPPQSPVSNLQSPILYFSNSLLLQFSNFFTRQPHRIHNVLIARATTEIPRKRMADLIFGGIRVLFQEWNHAHQNPWRAVAALKSVRLPKGLLEWMQIIFVWRKSFDRCDLMPVGLDGKG